MRKILLSLVVVSTVGLFSKTNAQCDLAFSNLVITNADGAITLGPNKCQYYFNASFDITTNTGFKYLFFHSWLKEDYPSQPIFDCSSQKSSDPGTSAQLGTSLDQAGKSFMDLGFINLNALTFPVGVPVPVTANIATTYPHDNSVELTHPGNSTGMTAVVTRISSSVLHFDLNNVRLVVNKTCGLPIIVATDIWGSNQAAPDPKAQCYICGLSQSFNDPTISLQKFCLASPFQYQVGLTTTQTNPFNVVYKVYMDRDIDGVMEPTTDDELIYTSPTISLSASQSYNSGLVTLPSPYCCIEPWAQAGIYVQVNSPDAFGNIISTPIVEEACAPLPIKLKSFNASRNRSDVLLKWETQMEDNNKGFAIQRLIGSGTWQTIGFVPTKASGGSSSSPVSYEFTDINTTKGISQYRLKQVDIDGRQTFSPIRSVRGEAQKNLTVIYPNPSNDGKINIMFTDANSIRDVSVMDMNGRLIKQYKGISNNNIQIENLNAGIYSVRIVDTQTGEQVVEKFVVNKR